MSQTCSNRFKGWWLRCARHYGAAWEWSESRRYGLMWYAYQRGWRHAMDAMKAKTDEPAAR